MYFVVVSVFLHKVVYQHSVVAEFCDELVRILQYLRTASDAKDSLLSIEDILMSRLGNVQICRKKQGTQWAGCCNCEAVGED